MSKIAQNTLDYILGPFFLIVFAVIVVATINLHRYESAPSCFCPEGKECDRKVFENSVCYVWPEPGFRRGGACCVVKLPPGEPIEMRELRE